MRTFGAMVGGATLSAAPESMTVLIFTHIWVTLILPGHYMKRSVSELEAIVDRKRMKV